MVIGITQSIRPKNGNEFELTCLVYFAPAPKLFVVKYLPLVKTENFNRDQYS